MYPVEMAVDEGKAEFPTNELVHAMARTLRRAMSYDMK